MGAGTCSMPAAVPVTNPPASAEVSEARRNALFYMALTVVLAGAWFALRQTVSFKVALPIVGGLGVEAWKRLQRWRELHNAQPGVPRIDSERLRQAQQEAVAVLSQAARARAW